MAKRRGNGEGSIRKRKDGRWEGRYTAGHDPETGKTIYKNVLGKTQAEVRDKLRQAIADAERLDFSKVGGTGEELKTSFESHIAAALDEFLGFLIG